ncbi:hypothetical protein IF2G_06066 [Cordyceps javanica]|nr:hypothetical protein IF2G_06066 [Cordyceps javanica]
MLDTASVRYQSLTAPREIEFFFPRLPAASERRSRLRLPFAVSVLLFASLLFCRPRRSAPPEFIVRLHNKTESPFSSSSTTVILSISVRCPPSYSLPQLLLLDIPLHGPILAHHAASTAHETSLAGTPPARSQLPCLSRASLPSLKSQFNTPDIHSLPHQPEASPRATLRSGF